MTQCSICIEDYKNSINRKKVSCGYCDYHSCVGCTQKYLLTQVVDAHCMNCRTGWNREFIDLNMSKIFRTTLWRDHKKNLILNREKAILPIMQRYAAAFKKMEDLQKILTKYTTELTTLSSAKHIINQKISTIRNNIIYQELTTEIEMEEYEKLNVLLNESNISTNTYYLQEMKQSKINYQYQEQVHIYNDTSTKKPKERKEFIFKCVKEGCRGFLSSAYKCDLCSTYVCKDCMIIKKEKDDDTHVCKKEDVDTVTMIRKDTRPCPKCGIRISKIDGCDQMWCVAEGCGTPFSWNSGQVISGVIHNPHYYEWVRRNNGDIPRNPGDVDRCGANVNVGYHELYRILNINGIYPMDRLYFSNIHRCILDIEHVRFVSYPQTRSPNMFKELHCDFLLNKIQEDAWRQSMFIKENNFEKKQQIGLILRTFVTITQDTLNKFYQDSLLLHTDFSNNKNEKKFTEDTTKLITKYKNEFNQIHTYINESLISTGTVMMCAVPQIGKEWNWIPIAKVEKILELKKLEEEKKEKEEKAKKIKTTIIPVPPKQ